MEEGDEIQIGVINENSGINGKNPGEDGSEENSDQSEVIVNSKSSVDTVEKRKFNFLSDFGCMPNIYIYPSHNHSRFSNTLFVTHIRHELCN